MTVFAVQVQARTQFGVLSTQFGNLSPQGRILRPTLASKAMTKSFSTDMSFDNSMNQLKPVK